MRIHRSHPTKSRRRAFTLPELLVATALVVLIMAIISDAFSQALQGFRELKSTGDLQEKLRTTATVLRRDLLAHHFEANRKLSDEWATRNTGPGTLPPGLGNAPGNPFPPGIYGEVDRPEKGFFAVYEDHNQSGIEGVDVDGVSSLRGKGVLHFTVNLRGDRPSDFFVGRIPSGPLDSETPPQYREPGTLKTQWAEIAYFLIPSTDSRGQALQTTTGLPRFSLHRRVRLLIDGSGKKVADDAANRQAYSDVSFWSDGISLNFNTPKDVTDKSKRSMNTPSPAPHVQGRQGDDLLMTDVVSFTAELFQHGENRFQRVGFRHSNSTNTLHQYDSHDTSQNGTIFYRLRGIRITMRIWDSKLEKTRQVTIIQDL